MRGDPVQHADTNIEGGSDCRECASYERQLKRVMADGRKKVAELEQELEVCHTIIDTEYVLRARIEQLENDYASACKHLQDAIAGRQFYLEQVRTLSAQIKSQEAL